MLVLVVRGTYRLHHVVTPLSMSSGPCYTSLPCYVFSTWTSLEAPCPYPSLSGYLITSPTALGVPVTHVGSSGTMLPTGLAV